MSFSKIDLEFPQVRLNCVRLRMRRSSIYAGLCNVRHRRHSVDLLALFAYVNDKSGISYKVVGQNIASSPALRLRFSIETNF